MVTSRTFPMLGQLIAFFLFVEIGANRSAESCPREAVVDLTETGTNPSGYVEKGGNIFPPNATWCQDDKKFGCPCSFETCVSFCCAMGSARQEGECIKDLLTLPRNITFIDDDHKRREFPEENYHPFTNDPCLIGWMASSIVENFSVFKNGSIYVAEFYGGPISGFDEYCLMRKPKSTKYVAKVCRAWVRKGDYEISCVIVAILIMIAIFITYPRACQLRNLHGMMFLSYVATYIWIYVFALAVMYTTELRIDPLWFSFAEIPARFFCTSCAFWLTVMSFNIWRSFRTLQPLSRDFKAQERKKFIWYAIYAWMSPIVLIAIAAVVMNYVPYFRDDTVGEALKQWGSVAVVTFPLIFNTVLHTLTALSIRRQKMDTADLVNGMNKHYEVEKKWFNLYLKLFVIMGAHIFVWPVFLVWPTPTILHLLSTMEVLQSILIFVIFIWNDNVKRFICQQFYASWVINTIHRMQSMSLHAQQVPDRDSGPTWYGIELSDYTTLGTDSSNSKLVCELE